MLKRFCFYPLLCIGVIIVLFFTLPFLLGLIFRDSELTDASDFVLAPREIPREKNGYFDFDDFTGEEVPDEITDEINLHLSGEKWDSSFVETTLTKYSYLYEAVESAAQKSSYQDPRTANPSQANYVDGIPDFYGMTAVRINNLKALSLMKEGKEAEAFEQAYYAIKIGKQMEESYGSLISYLIASTVKKKGIETLIILTNEAKDAEVLRTYAQKLSEVYPNVENIKRAYKIEYHLFKSIFAVIEKNHSELDPFMDLRLNDIEEFLYPILKKTGWAFYFHPHHTENLYYQNLKGIIEGLNSETDVAESYTLYPRGAFLYFKENIFGWAVLEAITPKPFSKERIDTENLLIESTQTAMLNRAQALE